LLLPLAPSDFDSASGNITSRKAGHDRVTGRCGVGLFRVFPFLFFLLFDSYYLPTLPAGSRQVGTSPVTLHWQRYPACLPRFDDTLDDMTMLRMRRLHEKGHIHAGQYKEGLGCMYELLSGYTACLSGACRLFWRSASAGLALEEALFGLRAD
jgi:hypothetical protein